MLAHPQLMEASRAKAQETSCVSNLRQVALACMMFVQDWDQKFALKSESYKKSLMPYIKNKEGVSLPRGHNRQRQLLLQQQPCRREDSLHFVALNDRTPVRGEERQTGLPAPGRGHRSLC